MVFSLKPVKGKEFIGRKKLVSEMVFELSNIKSKDGFALYGIRRIGKSSVMYEVIRRLEKIDAVVPVYFSLWDLTENTLEEFSIKLSSKILDAYKNKISLKYKVKNLRDISIELLKQIIKELKVSVKVKNDIEFLLSFEKGRTKPDFLVEKVFGLAEELAKDTNTKCVLFLDEFPDIVDLKNGKKVGKQIINKIRTIFERYKYSVLCIAGSIRKTMDTTVLHQGSAFYGELICREIKPLPKKDVFDLVELHLKATKKAKEKIYTFSNGIPFYIQVVGRELLKKRKIDEKAVIEAINEFIEQEGNLLFRERFEVFSVGEKQIILLMSHKGKITYSVLNSKLGKKISNISTYLSYLEEKGEIHKIEKGKYKLLDPVFGMWLKKVE